MCAHTKLHTLTHAYPKYAPAHTGPYPLTLMHTHTTCATLLDLHTPRHTPLGTHTPGHTSFTHPCRAQSHTEEAHHKVTTTPKPHTGAQQHAVTLRYHAHTPRLPAEPRALLMSFLISLRANPRLSGHSHTHIPTATCPQHTADVPTAAAHSHDSHHPAWDTQGNALTAFSK